jgi:hypothetical protein
MMKRTIPALALTLTFSSFVDAGAPPFPPFTADVEMTARGTTQSGNVAFGNGRMRTEMSMGPQKMTSIVDYDAAKVYVLMPQPMGCMEQPIQHDPNDPFVSMIDSAKEEALGEEEIDGHPTKKVRVTSTYGGETHKSLLWKAQDLKGLPVRVAAEDGSFTMNYKNVKLGEPDAKLVTPPADCKPNPFAGAGGQGKPSKASKKP